MLILADTPRANAAKVLHRDEKTLANILHYWVEDAVGSRHLDAVKKLAIDETSFHKGHRYVTIVIDAERRCVIGVEPGRNKEAVQNFANFPEQQDGNRENIKAVSSDMSKSYVPAVAEQFPNVVNAVHVIDKFHVKQTFQTALDEVRKQEQKEVASKEALFQDQRLFRIPKAKLTDKQAKNLTHLSRLYPKTERAYRIVASLDTMYACTTTTEAKTAFGSLYPG